MSNEELRKASRLSVRRSESGPGWETVTSFCCLGGCDMDVYSFLWKAFHNKDNE